MWEMSDFELPEVPELHLSEPTLTMPRAAPPHLLDVPDIHVDPSLAEGLGGGGVPGIPNLQIGGGSVPDLNRAFDFMTETPAAPSPQIQDNGFVSRHAGDFLNPWLRDPQGTAEDAERERQRLPPTDPGLDKDQHMIHSPTFRF
jgi:hypothetical protein